MNRTLLALATSLVALGAPLAGQVPPDSATAQVPDSATAQAPDSAGPRGGRQERSDWDRLTENAAFREGYFDSYQTDTRLLFVVPETRLGERFLLSFEASQGPGAGGIYGGTMLDMEARIVSFEKRAGRMFLIQHQNLYTADADSPTQRAIELTFGESVLATARIETTRDSVDHLVDVHDWFLSDISEVSERLRGALAGDGGRGGGGGASIDDSRSYLEPVRAFPRNLTIDAALTFRSGGAVGLRSVPDSRYIPVTVHARVAALPEVAMATRAADDRVGYFLTAQKDFSRDDGQDYFQRFVKRWRLECAGAPDRQGMCTPRQTITYYLDRTIPEEYRPAIREGIEAWNEAFEEAGFRNAIRAELLPDSADAEDIRYATIRWNVSDPPGYSAIGPSMMDPRTGEILDADILMEGNMILGFRNAWRFQVSPAAAVQQMLGADDSELARLAAGGESASFASEMAAQGTLIRAMLQARGELGPSAPVPMEYVNDAVRWITMHEVGHTLGLRHNFRASVDTPNERLADTDWTRERGLTGSVMDYLTPNIAPPGQPNGDLYTKGLGTYDRWAIAYGYTRDDERAAELAREAAQPGRSYGTDEDTSGRGVLDPTTNMYDLGHDPLLWGMERAQTIRSTWADIPSFALEDGTSYATATAVFESLLNQYARALATGVKYIGGQYQYRDHVGDPGGRGPWQNVPRERQVAALAFLVEHAFSQEAFALPEEVLQQFGADRWNHWGTTGTIGGRIDYPYHTEILDLQRMLLEQITAPTVFARIRDAEMKFGAAEVLTIPELLESLSDAVWAEVRAGTSVPSMRRDLQRAHLDLMVRLVTDAPNGTPADARAVARMTLEALGNDLLAAMGSRDLDAYTRAHLNESRVRVERALDAGLELVN